MARKYTRIKNSQFFSTSEKSEMIKALRAHYTPTLYKANSTITGGGGGTLVTLNFDAASFYWIDLFLSVTAAAVVTYTLAGTGATMVGIPASNTPGTAGARVQGTVITGAVPATLALTVAGAAQILKGSVIIKNEIE